MPTGYTDLVAKDGTPLRKGRISPALRTAIKLIVEEGLSQADAAKRTGYKPTSLTIALGKPHVRAYRADVKRAWLASKTERAYITVAELAEHSASDDVRLKAAKVLIDMDRDAQAAMPERARQVVQIITQNVNMGEQLMGDQLSGVIEAQPFHMLEQHPSDSERVRRADPDEDEG